MDSLDVVKILGVGLSGFGFLLMYLAYKLIQSLVPLPNANPLVIKTINRYMLICFIMTVTVGFFTFITTSYKNDFITMQTKNIQNKSNALTLLTASQKNSIISDRIASSKKNTVIIDTKKEQEKALDTLAKYIAIQNSPQLNREFSGYRTSVLRLSDSLNMPNLGKQKIDSLKSNYIQLNKSISNLSLKIATGKVSKLNQKVNL